MPCKNMTFKITGALHFISLFISLVGVSLQIRSVQKDEPFSLWLPLSLAIVMILRVPNQICLAFTHRNAWLSVIGTSMAFIGYIYLTYENYIHSKNKSQSEL